MLDYKLLEAFAAIIETGGFDKAANQLNITQSAVSQRLRLLEDNIGQILISRTSPPKPTQTGKNFLKHYLKVHHLESEMIDSLSGNSGNRFTKIPIGINADSLATWFLPLISEFITSSGILMDYCIDDQDVTHKYLRNGKVMGCISSRDVAIQGCSSDFLGKMRYRPLGTPEFIQKYFNNGFNIKSAQQAPVVIFNRKDDLQFIFLRQSINLTNERINIHYVPSSESFVEMIASGAGYGMVPDLQSVEYIKNGNLVPIVEDFTTDIPLYWHSWNLKSKVLLLLTKTIIQNSQKHIF